MVLNFGIDPYNGIVAFFHPKTEEYHEFNIAKVDVDDIGRIDQVFDDIKSKVTMPLGCACVCLDSGYGIEIRQKFLKTGIAIGFDKVEIIDRNSALYFESVYGSTVSIKSGDIIWILYSKNCYIWKKTQKSAQFVFRCIQPPEKVISHLQENKLLSSIPNIIINQSKDIKIDQLQALFPGCKLITGDKIPKWIKGAIVKAEIMDGNLKFKQLNANTVLGQNITVMLGENEIFSLPFYTNLPTQKSIILQKNKDENVIKVKRVFPTFDINLPECSQYSLELSVDTNGIHTTRITPLDFYCANATTSENITCCIGVDINRCELSSYSTTSEQTFSTTFKKKTNDDDIIDIAFQQIKNIITPGNKTIVFHIDDNCNNDVLLKYYKASQKFGVENISFISTQTAELLNILSTEEHKNRMTNETRTIAYICDKIEQRKLYCQIWKRHGNCFKAESSYFREEGPGADMLNLKKLKTDSNSLEGVDLAFVDSYIDKKWLT